MRVAVAAVSLVLIACSKPDAKPASAAADSADGSVSLTPPCIITDSAIAAVRLGMTPTDLKNAWPEAMISRTSDGEGVALIDISVGEDHFVVAYSGEDDASQPVDTTKQMTQLETFSPRCATAEGVHPGMASTEVEAILGKTRSVETSEIESRRFIQFENQPGWMTIRVDEDNRLMSIAIASTQ